MQHLFALGSNGSGQLGLLHTHDISVPKPVPLPQDTSITSIAAGGNHTLLLTTTGAVLLSGDGNPSFQPIPIPTTTPITHIAATWTTSHLATPTALYSLGTGLKGGLALGPLIIRAPKPELVPNFPPKGTTITGLSASMGHAAVVLSDGSLWGWGAARKGQLGSGVSDVVDTPRRVEAIGFDHVTRAVCGKEFTVCFGKDGEVVVLGADKWGIKEVPAREEIAGWKEVGAGWGNVFVLRQDGRVVSWGRDDHGQRAPGDLGTVRKIAVGSEHALALTAEGEVVAWGWGEHGNCGPVAEGDGKKGQRGVIASLKYVPKGAKITMIGAGCATSWVAIEMPES
ncbi:hypothetical protein OQA88_577 [Cercophora sp. LCS_1]